MSMQATSAAVLEFELLRQLLGRYIASPLGRAELEKVQPHTDRERLDSDLAEAAEATEYLRAAVKPQPAARGSAIRINFSSIPDLSHTVHKLRIEGATLEPKEICDVLAFLDRAADARSILQSVTERFPRLGRRAQSIGEFRALLNDLAGKIEPDGTIPNHASVALGRLRREIDRQKKSIQDSLERFLRTHHEEGVFQEEFVTIRNERFVVPVIAGQRRKIDGVIHGASSSGHTLFVEPLATIDLNNELVRLTEEELREVHRILRELTERLRGYAD
jgi:DNA mismatch repair protein MutS2